MSKRIGIALAALALVAAVAVVAHGRAAGGGWQATRCPAGYKTKAALEAAERAAGVGHAAREHAAPNGLDRGLCVNNKHPEPATEVILRNEALESVRSAPFDHPHPGAFGAAVGARGDNVKNTPRVKGTEGTWTQYGQGPLIVNDPAYGSVNKLGLVYNSARLDSLEYDPVNKRLFAAEGTGGVWMSTDGGASWRSIGDALPSQVVGAVGWSPANGGTVVAVSGDPSFGSGGYTGYGAFYSTNLGSTWTKATGIPDGALGFAIEVDPTNSLEVYAATSFGLFRSLDGGKTYANTKLPTGPCAGIAGAGANNDRPECLLANVVTDVEVSKPGGVNTTMPGGTVIAAVGWRAGARANSNGTVQSPSNGLYRSTSGAPGSFDRINPTVGFARQDRIGRVELGTTTGPQQDHDYLYAIVQDAAALNGELDILDVPAPDPTNGTRPGTVLNGLYVSPDFGLTWTLMADDNAIARNPATGSALVGANFATGYEPGVQAWYNEWIAPDPTRQTAAGVPTRLAFGLEEVWQNELTDQPLSGPTTFKVIARYYGGGECLGLVFATPPPACPTHRDPATGNTTTHPDQQDGIWIPDGTGGVTLAVGNDGGFFRNHVDGAQELNNGGWGNGDQTGFSTVLPYDAAMANDGTVYAGLQDNGELKITPDHKQYETYGGDGGYSEVDPWDSNVAYEEYVYGDMSATTDGGKTWRSMGPAFTSARFINPFEMDNANASHLITGANEIYETIYGPETNGPDSTGACSLNCWQKVFDLGTRQHPGDPSAAPPATDAAADPNNSTSAIDVYGDAAYVGFCGVCDILNAKVGFKSGIATNVGGTKPQKKMTSDGWHIAAANGLPNRFVTSVTIDPNNIRTVYVTLGGYGRRWVPPGTLQDSNAEVGEGHLYKSTDAGENFTDISGNLPDVPATSLALRGGQLIVGTDVGVFANDLKGGSKFSVLTGLPIVPISMVNLKPNDPNLLVVATYGRGVWTFRFTTPLRNPPVVSAPGCLAQAGAPPATSGTSTVAGPYGFESGEDGWTAGSSNQAFSLWRRLAPGNGSTYSFAVMPYNGDGLNSVTTTLGSPKIDQAGGWTYVEFAARYDTEPTFDYVFVDWSCDGGKWNTATYVWDPATGGWSDSFQMNGSNPSFPLYDTEKVAFQAPAGPLYLRFRLVADSNTGSPPYTGVSVDDIVVKH